MRFSVIFWNIWLDNQLKGPENAKALLGELEHITNKYQPDFIGLNEVLKNVNHQSPFVTDHMSSLGYVHTHYAPAGNQTNDWLVGTAVSSKHPLLSTEILELGSDPAAARAGFPNHVIKAIATKVKIGTKNVGLVVAHPVHLRNYTLKEHYKHTKSLSDFIKATGYSNNTIIGGDFNEPHFMPKSFRWANRKLLNYKSGSFRNPTWRFNASKLTPIRANLDKLFWTKNGSLKLLGFKIIPTNVSDHRPLFAVFEYT